MKKSSIAQVIALAGLIGSINDPILYDPSLDFPKFKHSRGTRCDVRDSKTNPKINRNDKCPCGSGKKYKKCCNN